MYTQYESWFDKPEKASFSPAVVQGYEDGDGAGLSQNKLLIDVPCDTASLSVICVLPLNFFMPSIGHWASSQSISQGLYISHPQKRKSSHISENCSKKIAKKPSCVKHRNKTFTVSPHFNCLLCAMIPSLSRSEHCRHKGHHDRTG